MCENLRKERLCDTLPAQADGVLRDCSILSGLVASQPDLLLVKLNLLIQLYNAKDEGNVGIICNHDDVEQFLGGFKDEISSQNLMKLYSQIISPGLGFLNFK